MKYVQGAELPAAGWWLCDGLTLADVTGVGWTFELKVWVAGAAASTLTKTSSITGQVGSGLPTDPAAVPNVVIVWATSGELNTIPAGRYLVQLTATRTSDGRQFIDQDDLLVLAGAPA